jgi:acetyltransferase-like isoleucine patch superfamily enzyme
MNKINLIISTLWYAILMFLPKEYSKFRVRYYNKKGCTINKKSTIYPNVRITGKFKIGKGSSIAQNCTISGENAGIFIGENVMVAPNVVIVAFNHGFESIKIPMVFQKNSTASVFIEDDVWVAANCTIGKG